MFRRNELRVGGAFCALVLAGALWAGEGNAPAAGGAGDLAEYRDIGQCFILRYPKTWSLIRGFSLAGTGTPMTWVTPQAGKQDPKDLTIWVRAHAEGIEVEPGEKIDPVAVLRSMVPLLRLQEPKMEPVGDVQPARLGSLPAAKLTFKGTPTDKRGTFIMDVYLAPDRELCIVVNTGAPEEQYGAYREVLERTLAGSEFGRVRPSLRLEKPLAGYEIPERYKGSVMAIHCDDAKPDTESFGTGFVITKDGYVATNAHNAIVPDRGPYYCKLNRNWEAVWDTGLHRAKQPLTLVGFLFKDLPGTDVQLYGTDVALFKLPPGEYTPVPLARLEDVKLEDRVINIGFPMSFVFATLTVVTSSGSVSRFNLLPNGQIVTISHNATQTHGNSGGPCFTLETGAAIGLATFGYDISLANTREGEADRNLAGWHGLVPAQAFLDEFPLVADLKLRPEQITDFFDAYELGLLFRARGSVFGAREMAEKAVQLRPGSAPAHLLYGLCLLKPSAPTPEWDRSKQGKAEIQKALEIDPGFEPALVALARLATDPAETLAFADRDLAAHPTRYRPYILKANACYALRRYDEALAAAAKAAQLSFDVAPEPYLLQGKILYDQGKLDEGKAAFARAVQIDPANLGARLALVQYHELRNAFDVALAGYQALENELPSSYRVITAVGRCLVHLGRQAEADVKFWHAEEQCQRLGERMPEQVALARAEFFARKNDTVGEALHRYSVYLTDYCSGPKAVANALTKAAAIHLKCARFLLGNAVHSVGLAHGHLRQAYHLDPNNPDVVAECRKQTYPPMTARDIRLAWMPFTRGGRLDYPDPVLADMVRVTPLNFGLSPRREVKDVYSPNDFSRDELRNLDDCGIVDIVGNQVFIRSMDVFRAILDSNQAFPPPIQAAPNPILPGTIPPNLIRNPDGTFHPAPGFEWVDPNNVGDLRVRPIQQPVPQPVAPGQNDPLGLAGTWIEYRPGVDAHDIIAIAFQNGAYTVRSSTPQGVPYRIDNVRVEGNELRFTQYAGPDAIQYAVRLQNANTCAVATAGGPGGGRNAFVWQRQGANVP